MKENKTKRSYEIDMCSGPLFSKIVLFALPLMASGVLQLLFNAADIIVVGRFAGSQSMAAVGSNGSLINLMVNVFIGLSIGANVLVARYYGARDEKNLEDMRETVLSDIKSDDFLEMLEGWSKELTRTTNNGAYNRYDPKNIKLS